MADDDKTTPVPPIAKTSRNTVVVEASTEDSGVVATKTVDVVPGPASPLPKAAASDNAAKPKPTVAPAPRPAVTPAPPIATPVVPVKAPAAAPAKVAPAPAAKAQPQAVGKTYTLTSSKRPPKRSKIFRVLFLIFGLMPSVFVAWYYYKIASPMYVSEMRMALKQPDSLGGTSDILSTLLKAPTTVGQDTQMLIAYVGSDEMLRDMDGRLALRAHYSDSKWDFYSRLPENATMVRFLEYWRWAVKAKIEADTGLLYFTVKAFTPEKAQAIMLSLMYYCEEMVKRLNEQARADTMARSLSEFARAEQRVGTALSNLDVFRREHNLMDLPSTVTMHLTIIGDLEAEITKVSAELTAKTPFYAEDHADVQIMKARLTALQNQLVAEKERLAGAESKQMDLSGISAEYEHLMTEVEFSRKQYTMAMTSVEAARIQADTQKLYLVPVSWPQPPDESLYPRRLLYACAFLGVNLLVYGLLSLVVAAIRDHAGV